MAARLNPQHDQRTRLKIKTSQLINRLQSFVNGKVEMQPHQVSAALGLLKKTLPDLASIEHSGGVDQHFVVSLPTRLETSEEWEKQIPDQTIQ